VLLYISELTNKVSSRISLCWLVVFLIIQTFYVAGYICSYIELHTKLTRHIVIFFLKLVTNIFYNVSSIVQILTENEVFPLCKTLDVTETI